MKTLHLVLGIFCATCVVFGIKNDVNPWVTILAVIASIMNFVAYSI